MKTALFYSKISSLPIHIQQEAMDFIEFLVNKCENKSFSTTPIKKHIQKKIHPKPGCMKGTFIMHPDFDKPLDDFKEYM